MGAPRHHLGYVPRSAAGQFLQAVSERQALPGGSTQHGAVARDLERSSCSWLALQESALQPNNLRRDSRKPALQAMSIVEAGLRTAALIAQLLLFVLEQV